MNVRLARLGLAALTAAAVAAPAAAHANLATCGTKTQQVCVVLGRVCDAANADAVCIVIF